MIRLTDDRRGVGGVALGGIWIGDSGDETAAGLAGTSVGAVLNVAQDMHSALGWRHGIEAMHVGLTDGPGNELAAYCAAVLALHALLRRHNVLVCCHSGGRSLAVAVMYLEASSPRGGTGSWNGWLALLAERTDAALPPVNSEHQAMFDKLNWRAISKLIGGTA